jgi:hypothetical protein
MPPTWPPDGSFSPWPPLFPTAGAGRGSAVQWLVSTCLSASPTFSSATSWLQDMGHSLPTLLSLSFLIYEVGRRVVSTSLALYDNLIRMHGPAHSKSYMKGTQNCLQRMPHSDLRSLSPRQHMAKTAELLNTPCVLCPRTAEEHFTER